jgi:hypothetical protein
MIRDVTGLNEARDGSLPDRNTLVGLQKLAANASNVATRHITQSSLYLTLKLAENISLKVADALEFPLTKSSLQNSISTYNIKTLDEVINLNLHDFGIFLELEPDEEEKQQLEANIQIALQAGNIDVEDAIDLRQIKNLKLANQMLKVKRKEKAKQDQANQQANIQAQAAAQADAAEKTAMSEVQKQQAISGANVEYEKAKSEFEKDRMQLQAQLDQQKMMQEHRNAMELAQIQEGNITKREQQREASKNKRIKMEGTQQSKMIAQRKNDSDPINFENEGIPGALVEPTV